MRNKWIAGTYWLMQFINLNFILIVENLNNKYTQGDF